MNLRKQCMNQDIYQEIKSQFKDEFSDLIDDFFESISQKSAEHSETKMPTLTEIESMWGQLSTETRDMFSRMIGKAISQMDESEIIASKKESTSKRG